MSQHPYTVGLAAARTPEDMEKLAKEYMSKKNNDILNNVNLLNEQPIAEQRKTKAVEVIKYDFSQALTIVFFNRVGIYMGVADHWGIGVEVSFYDWSLTFNVLNLYSGIEIYRKAQDD